MATTLKTIAEKVSKLFPDTNFIVFHNFIRTSAKVNEEYQLWVIDHTFKISGRSDSNKCDSIEGFISHLNYEFEGMDGWKPIPQTAKGKRELNLLKSE